MNIEEKEGAMLLKLHRDQKKYMNQTLNGWVVKRGRDMKQMYDSYAKEIDILSGKISARAKTRMRQECKERGIPYPSREALCYTG